MNTFLEVFMQRREELVQLLLEHIQMTSAAVLISICIGIPLGIFVTKNKRRGFHPRLITCIRTQLFLQCHNTLKHFSLQNKLFFLVLYAPYLL